MIDLKSEIEGLARMEKARIQDMRLIRAHTRKRLSYWGRVIITSIKKDGGLFTNESKGANSIKGSLWTKRVVQREPLQQIGWGVPHGEIMEYGPQFKRVWEITPSGFRSDISIGRSGGGVGLRFLRFEYKGKIVYARKVTHRWGHEQLRPHMRPWVDHWKRHILQDLAAIPKRVIAGELR